MVMREAEEADHPLAAELRPTAIGFRVHYIIALALLTMNALTHIANRSASSSVPGHAWRETDTGSIQTGFARCHLRGTLRFLTLIFAVWLQVLLYDITENKYRGTWSFPPPYGMLTWDSYTRAFLLPWLASVLGTLLYFLEQGTLKVHYLRPVALADAEFVLITAHGRDNVTLLPVNSTARGDVHYFSHRLQLHTYDGNEGAYRPPTSWEECRGSVLRQVLQARSHGHHLTSGDAAEFTGEQWRRSQRLKHGLNVVNVEVPRLVVSIWAECLTLFNLYQYFALWLMFYWETITIALLIACLLIASTLVKVFAERSLRLELQRLARLECQVRVLDSDGVWRHTTSTDLVPGDIMLAGSDGSGTTGSQLPCDLVLVQGHCVVDESMLTGESMPVTKVEMPDDSRERPSSRSEFKKHYLFAGTRVVQASGFDAAGVPGAACIVVGTAGGTARGELLQALLYGESAHVPLEQDAQKVFGGLVVLAFIGFMAVGLRFGFTLGPVLSGIFMVIQMVNPLLSVAILAGQLAGAKRLRAVSEVFCRDIQRLAVAGCVDAMLFDKTGTLTEQGLELVGCLPAWGGELLDLRRLKNGVLPDLSPELLMVVAHAHAVQKVGWGNDNPRLGSLPKFIGHELELQMVRAAQWLGWTFDWSCQPLITTESEKCGKFEVLKIFEFDHETMTMSVVARASDSSLHVFSKGSMEAIAARTVSCSLGTTQGLEWAAERLARSGSYVLCCAHRLLEADADVDGMRRAEIESGLTRVGALVFRNELKADTAGHLAVLEEGGIAVAMVTGDHALTGISVARVAGLVPEKHEVWLGEVHEQDAAAPVRWRNVDSGFERPLEEIPRPASLAVTGAAFDALSLMTTETCADLQLPSLVHPADAECGLTIRVFARMAPGQKIAVVSLFQDTGLVVGFCGDGGNDSGALRAAHAGLALSGKAEASIAAPCATPRSSLKAVVELISEGRASLCTSIAAFRFLALKGIIFVLGKAVILFSNGVYISPLAYLYIDLFMVPVFLWAITQTLPRPQGLAPGLPARSLLSARAALAPFLCIIVDGIFYYMIMAWLSVQNWYVPFDTTQVPIYAWQFRADNFEAPVTMLWICWCTVDLALVVSYGGAHRIPLCQNYPVLATAAFCHIVQLVALFYDDWGVGCAMKINCSQEAYRSLTTSPLNYFLFHYERIGGEFYAPGGSNHLSTEFKWQFFVLLILTSLANHGVYLLVETGLDSWKPAPLLRPGSLPEAGAQPAAPAQPQPFAAASGVLGAAAAAAAAGTRRFQRFEDDEEAASPTKSSKSGAESSGALNPQLYGRHDNS